MMMWDVVECGDECESDEHESAVERAQKKNAGHKLKVKNEDL